MTVKRRTTLGTHTATRTSTRRAHRAFATVDNRNRALASLAQYVTPPPGWRDRAACRDLTPGDADRLFFAPSGMPTREAKDLCAGCPVRAACLNASVGEKGFWGGLTEADRRRLAELSGRLDEWVEFFDDPGLDAA